MTPLDRFFAHYYARRPVNATFTGVHDRDSELPDWSPEGLRALSSEMKELRQTLAAVDRTSLAPFPDGVDLDLAIDFLDIQQAEIESGQFYQRNPSLYVGEAVFSFVSLLTRDFAPLPARAESAAARLTLLPEWLQQATRTIDLERVPAEWAQRARRECAAAQTLLGPGVVILLRERAVGRPLAERLTAAATAASTAFGRFDRWLATRDPRAIDEPAGCGALLFDLLLARGHHVADDPARLLPQLRRQFDAARARLDDDVRTLGVQSWSEAQALLAADHPSPEGLLSALAERWRECQAAALERDLVTWPAAPLRYVFMPRHTREAAPYLYYLFYRSPAPFDALPVHDYVVTPVNPAMTPAEQTRHLRAWNRSAITLNHVAHHGAIGHHVQNAYASRAASRTGQIAAVDCASRIGMFCGGTLAEGWACYAVDLMEEVGFLTPGERAAQQHTRLRLLGRAIVDLELNRGRMTAQDAQAFYRDQVGMPDEAARAEVVKNAMFPATAVMYWLGTDAIHRLRADEERRLGAAFSLRRFHDAFLGYGALPVNVIADLIKEEG